MSALDKQEQDLLQHVEVYGMNPHRAGQLLNIINPHDVLKRPHVIAARESIRRTLQSKTRITKEDVIEGIKTAIDQGFTLGDPQSQVRGWVEIAKLLNMYEPQKIDIRLSGTIKELRSEMASLSEEELLALAGPEADVIDADFYTVNNEKSADRTDTDD